jgi:predicted house-cleaning noncanonical NTP pyrophosphatase (MazG superfamily)
MKTTDDLWSHLNEEHDLVLVESELDVIVDLCNEIRWQSLQDELHEWTVKMFGNPTDPKPSLHHLKEEVNELIADHQSAEEWADCFIILIHSAKKAGLNMSQIYWFIKDKHRINKSRKWSSPDENGVCYHLK